MMGIPYRPILAKEGNEPIFKGRRISSRRSHHPPRFGADHEKRLTTGESSGFHWGPIRKAQYVASGREPPGC